MDFNEYKSIEDNKVDKSKITSIDFNPDQLNVLIKSLYNRKEKLLKSKLELNEAEDELRKIIEYEMTKIYELINYVSSKMNKSDAIKIRK